MLDGKVILGAQRLWNNVLYLRWKSLNSHHRELHTNASVYLWPVCTIDFVTMWEGGGIKDIWSWKGFSICVSMYLHMFMYTHRALYI